MSTQTATQAIPVHVNGTDVSQIMNVIGEVEQDANYASFQFRATNRWIDGGLNRSRIQSFFAGGQENDTRTDAFTLDADEPPINAGADTAPNPLEYLLHALASCMTTTLVYHAAVRDIEIAAVESSLEGDIDIRGMLGMAEDVRKGFHHVRVRMRVRSNESIEALTELAMFSPVYDIVSKSLPVELVLEEF
jgi:uncharacterized OsmC-like protein